MCWPMACVQCCDPLDWAKVLSPLRFTLHPDQGRTKKSYTPLAKTLPPRHPRHNYWFIYWSVVFHFFPFLTYSGEAGNVLKMYTLVSDIWVILCAAGGKFRRFSANVHQYWNAFLEIGGVTDNSGKHRSFYVSRLNRTLWVWDLGLGTIVAI